MYFYVSMQVFVTTSFRQWEDKAGGYVNIERAALLGVGEEETVGEFADRACDILMPRGAADEGLTPAQWRMSCCRHLARRGNGHFPDEDLLMARVARDGSVIGDEFVLKPKPLAGG